jgi:membrane protein DedA with SNARE-associated domain
MLDSLISTVGAVIIAIISAGGYAGIVLLMAIESACIPLPSEIIMPFAGYLVSTGRFDLFLVATAGALGCNLGSAVAYAVGRYGGRPAIDRWGAWVMLSHADLDLAERFFARYGSITVFVARLLPVIRTFIALPAGIARMPQLRFHIYTFLGSWIWCLGLAFVGMKLGQAWDSSPLLKSIMHRLDVVIILGLVLLVVWHVRRHRRGRALARR